MSEPSSPIKTYYVFDPEKDRAISGHETLKEAIEAAEYEAADRNLTQNEWLEVVETVAVVRTKPITTYTTVL